MKRKIPDERPVMTFRIDPDLAAGLRQLFDRDGISQSESIRRALRMWLDTKGITTDKPTTKTTGTRRKDGMS